MAAAVTEEPDMTAAEVESNSACWCFTGTKALSVIAYLLNQIEGSGMTKEEVEENSACWCFTGSTFDRVVTYLLAQIEAGGGGGGGGSTAVTNSALAGNAPASDGSVTTKWVFDTDTGFLWYNSGTLATPTWNNV